MVDALEAACNDPLPAYADLTKHIAEDGVDALRLMLKPVEELSDIFRRLDAADGLVHLHIPVTEEMIRGEGLPSDAVLPRVSRSCRSIIYEDSSQADTSAASLSADTVMGIVSPDRVQRCQLVYERRHGGRFGKNLVGNQVVVAFPVVEENVDDLIVDPHPLEFYGEVLHTPAEVMATLSKK
ncbi:hypothetical protein Hanom_Chr17g01556051 [Helianthus anomalus]